jgi:two-component system phosphate regulon response regulator PhoB
MKRTSILLVDDEPYLTFMVGSRLRERGADVRIAANGEEALRMAREQRPDLVITDFQMLRMSGLDLAKTLRSQNETADVPIIMLTSRAHRVSPQELAATCIKHLVAKPFSFRELVPLVAEFCDIDSGDQRGQPLRQAS